MLIAMDTDHTLINLLTSHSYLSNKALMSSVWIIRASAIVKELEVSLIIVRTSMKMDINSSLKLESSILNSIQKTLHHSLQWVIVRVERFN